MHESLNTFVNLVVSIYFVNFRCIYYIGPTTSRIWIRDYPVVNGEEKYLSPVFLQVHGCEGIIVESATPRLALDRFESSIEFRNLENHYANVRKYIFLVDGIADEIFKSKHLNNLTDLLVVCFNSTQEHSSNQRLELSTHAYSYPKFNEQLFLDAWFVVNKSFLLGNNLFPNKLKNQQGRKLWISCLHYIPYSRPSALFYSGSELNLVKTYAKMRNITLVTNRLRIWGVVNDTGFGTGMLGSVLRHESDVAFSGIFISYMTYKHFEYSHVYIESEITCIVPSPRIMIPLNFLLPKYEFRFALILLPTTVIMVIVAYKLAKRKQNFTRFEAFLLVLRIILQQSFSKKLTGIGVYIMHVVFFSLITYTTYSTNLTSWLVVPRYEGNINNALDLAKSNLKVVAKEVDLWTRAFIKDTRPHFKKLLANAKELEEGYGNDESVAYIVERFPSGYYAFNDAISDKVISNFKPMSGKLYSSNSVFIFKKNSVIVPDFNMHLLQIQQSGIYLKWEQDAFIHSKSYNKQDYIQHQINLGYGQKSLSFKAIRGPLSLLLMGISIATVTFIFELWHAQKK